MGRPHQHFKRGQVILGKRLANDGNLSIPPLYVRRISIARKAVGEEKSEHAVDELNAAIQAWEESSIQLQAKMNDLLNVLENQ